MKPFALVGIMWCSSDVFFRWDCSSRSAIVEAPTTGTLRVPFVLAAVALMLLLLTLFFVVVGLALLRQGS